MSTELDPKIDATKTTGQLISEEDYEVPQLNLVSENHPPAAIMMDEDDDEEMETKPSSISIPCLICIHGYQPEQDSDRENQEIFDIVCNTLKIKMGKKNSWDFSKELLPFCPSCVDVSEDLLTIERKIGQLQEELRDKTEQLKRLFAESTTTTDVDEYDKRFIWFRRQVKGATLIENNEGRRTSKRKSDNLPKTSPLKSSKSSSVPPKVRFKAATASNVMANALSEDDGEESESQGGRRRSTRICAKRKSVHFILPTDEEEESEDVDLAQIQSEEFSDRQDSSVTDNTACPSLRVEIKQEMESETEARMYQEEPELKTSKNKRKTRKQAQVATQRIKKASTKRPQESEEEEDSDYYGAQDDTEAEAPSENDSEEEGKQESSIYRKLWKKDKSTGKLFYDGVEVIPIQGGLKCSKCDVTIEGDKGVKHKLKMKRHMITKHLERFVCVLCGKVLSAKKYLDMHVRMVHEKSVTILCDICEKPFTSKNAMRRHRWNHQNDEEKEAAIASGKKQYESKNMTRLQCLQCGKLCQGPYNLKRHEETHMDLKDREKHMCQICGALYSAPETLRSHIKLAHDNNNQLQWLKCPHCPKKYPQPGRLEKHMRSHTGEKPYVCDQCGRSFSQPTLLKVHVLKHKNIRPHQCLHCEMSFFRRYHLQRHTQTYHESAKPPTKKQPYRSENGTRKTPQKRERKKPPAQQPRIENDPLELEDNLGTNQVGQHLQQNSDHIVDPLGMVDNTQQFFAGGNNTCNYPFATYAYAHPGLHQ